jgi:acetoin utilization protein AcuB
MREARIRHLPVIDPDLRLIGLITHRDLVGHAPSDLEEPREEDRIAALAGVHVGDIMETHLSTSSPEERLIDAGRRMLQGKIGCLPVVGGGGRLVGIITESDFVRWTTTLAAETGAADGGRGPTAGLRH